ncbi:MAG: DUF805 domain-containing protein [Deltaproteobacteria bacterium]|nr:DUF805 domain-containing protein [Deltaproteobacteria bacterium]
MNTMNPASSPHQLGPFQAFSLVWSRYAEFQGRSSRMEFWSFYIIYFFISFFLSLFALIPLLLGGLIFGAFLAFFFSIPGVIFWLLYLIPYHAVWVRRLHDVGSSGWWVFWSYASLATIPLVKSGLIPDAIKLSGSEEHIETLTLAIMFAVAVNLIVFIMLFVDGVPGTNKYGPNPKLNPTNPNNPF